MRTSPVDNHLNYAAYSKRPPYHIHHLRRKSLLHFDNELSLPASSTGRSSGAGKNSTKSRKGCVQNFDMYLKSYCDMSSLHGFRYFAESDRPLYERCFWLLAIAFVFYGMVTTIHSQILSYLKNPILMSLNSKVVPAYDVPFPAITICPEHQTPLSILNISELIEASKTRELTLHESAKLNLAGFMCTDTNSKSSEVPLNPNFTSEFHTYGFLYAIQLCKLMVKSLSWKGKVEENPCSLIQISLNYQGFCFSFNMLPPSSMYSSQFIEDFLRTQPMEVLMAYQYRYLMTKPDWTLDEGYENKISNISEQREDIPYRISSGSFVNSAQFLLDLKADEIQESCKPRSNGFLVMVHNPCEHPTLRHPLAYVTADTRTVIHITPNAVKTDEGLRDWPPSARGCYYNHERKLMFFQTYTLNNCDVECETNFTLKLCNCCAIFQPHLYTTPICGPDKLWCHQKSLVASSSDSGHRDALMSACNCLPACNELTYDVKDTIQPRNFTYNTEEMYRIKKNETKTGSYVFMIALLTSRKVNSIVRVAIQSDSDFIANIGGLMGLFLGFSVISVCEILYFSTFRWLTDLYRRHKYKKKWKKIAAIRPKKSSTANRNNTAKTLWKIPFIKKKEENNVSQVLFVKPQYLK